MRKIFDGRGLAWRVSEVVTPGIFFFIMVFLLFGTARGQTPVSTVNTGLPPAWVEETKFENEPATPAGQDPYGRSRVFFEEQVNGASSETFFHLVKEIRSATEIQNGANLSFSYDPSYQKLTVHRIVVHRGGEVLDRLDPGKFKVIQQETDLSRQIYNGTLSAVLFLEDVRVGDEIEYTYTLSGKNPAWQDQYAATFLAGFSMPAGRLKYRLLWPEGRPLFFKTHGTDDQPATRSSVGMVEYVWDWQNLPAIVAEDRVPSWFPAYPWIQVSSFKDWSAVADWASQLYVNPEASTPALKESLAGLQRPEATAEQTAQAALEFVENDIRYLGFEFGPKSYHPTDPATVLQRRFGDCKDKAFLLCTLLHGLGYEATPVLVGTGFRQTLPDLLPAPDDFDHVIVCLTVNGTTYWVDPTDSYQRGPLDERYLPDYGFGLLLKPGETDLTPIPASSHRLAQTTTTETFVVGGQKAPAHLNVTTTFINGDAGWMRAVFASVGRESVAKNYLNDYARRYPGAVLTAPMIVEDLAGENVLTIRHQYAITNFWVLSADKENYNCAFYPLGIHSWIEKPETVNRTMPMEISFPRRRIVRTEVRLPREFNLSNLTNVITGPAAQLRVERTIQGSTFRLDYEYESLTNFVPVALVADHLKSLDEMENALNYGLVWQNRDVVQGGFNWPVFLMALFYSIALVAGLVMLYRRQRRLGRPDLSAPPPYVDRTLNGLSGWLILVALGLVLSPIRQAFFIVKSSRSFSPATWHALTTPGSLSYNPWWAPLLSLELLGQISLLILAVFSSVLFFRRRRGFPQWYVFVVAANAIFIVSDRLAVRCLLHTPISPAAAAKDYGAIIGALIVCCIWIPYMRVSRRVKATFTR